MSQINFTRKTFLEKEEIARLQQFLRDSPSENAIIGNTSKYGILRTDFKNGTDFLVEPSSNAGRVKIGKAENKAITSDGNMIYQEAIDNIEVPDDNLWYWMRIKYNYVTYEKGTVSINANGEVVGTGTQFSEVLRGQGTQVPTKVKFLKMDGTPAVNSGFYEVVDIVNNTNMVLTSAVDFVAENDLRMVVLGTTPLGEMLSAEQQEGLYKYDSCDIEFIAEDTGEPETPPHLSMVSPDLTFVQDKMFYIARVKNNAGFVDVDNANPYVRAEFWEFNVVGLTDKLSIFNNLNDLNNPDLALTNLGLTIAGKNLSKISPNPYPSYLRLEANGTVKKMIKEEVVNDFRNYLSTIFLQRGNNLDDIRDIVAARENLDVYSKGEVYSKEEVDDVEEYDLTPHIASGYSLPTGAYAKIYKNGKTVSLHVYAFKTGASATIVGTSTNPMPERFRPPETVSIVAQVAPSAQEGVFKTGRVSASGGISLNWATDMESVFVRFSETWITKN